MCIAGERREQITDDAAPTGRNHHRHRHARRKRDGTLIDVQFGAVERDASRIDEFLSLWLASRDVGAAGAAAYVVARILRLVARNSIARDAEYDAVQEAIAGKREGIDFDPCVLTFGDETDVAVGDVRL